MKNTTYLHKYPYLRLIIPWIAGVFCGDRFFNESSGHFLPLFALCFFAFLSLLFHNQSNYSRRWCFGVSVFMLCFMGGWIGITTQLKSTIYHFPQKEVIYKVKMLENAQEKERTMLCKVIVENVCDSLQMISVDKNAILYLQKDSLTTQLKSGDELLVSADISPPQNNNNFDEFDYARYLIYKNISGTGYVASSKWRLIAASGSSESNYKSYLSRLRQKADMCREEVVSLYKHLGFKNDELAVLSALTIGDKTDLSDSVRESYSISGAAHVLALSGLHIGLLYALLFFILAPLARSSRWGYFIRPVLLLILLWTFAFITGLSPSVVRSVIMFSALAIAEMFGRKSLSINTVAATAWLMLLFNPVWLFDVGFQLSFMAVVAILLFQQPIYKLIRVNNKAARYIWGLLTVSIAAQIGTAPLVLYYFSQFSTHFLLTNLVVIPLVTIILYASVVMLVLTPIPFVQAFIAMFVNFLLKMLNGFVHWVEQLPYSSFEVGWIYPLEIVFVYVILLLFFYYCVKKGIKKLQYCLFSLIILGVFHSAMYIRDAPQSSLVFYNVRGCPAVHCIEADGRSWLNYTDSLSAIPRLKNATAGYWKRHRLLPPKELNSDYIDNVIVRRQQIISYKGRQICFVSDNRWRNKTVDTPLNLDYLYLCKGYSGKLKELVSMFNPSCIILDSSLTKWYREEYKKECRKLGIHFISLSEEGSVQFLL